MKRRGIKPVAAEEATVNLTPLIDVVFVILIMFIVVAPLLEIDRISLASAPAHEGVHDASPVTIQVYKDGAISLNQQPVPLEKLEGYLRLAKRSHPTARPHLFHDKQATFGTYQSVKNAVEAAGFAEMDILLRPE